MTSTTSTHVPASPIATEEEALASLVDSRDRARRWLLDHVGATGRPAGSEAKHGYYRLPWTLAVLGEREAAARVLSWMEDETLTPGGDLRKGVPRQGFVDRTATYALSIIACGAWQLERYDTAARVLNVLKGLTNPSTGGAYWERSEARTSGYEVAYPTAQLGLTALMLGDRDTADGVFSWFDRLVEAQDDLPDRLYCAWGPGGLVTEPPESMRFQCVVDFSAPRQAFYTPGISASFLIRYHQASGNERAKDIAMTLLDLSRHGTPEQFNYWESTQICKFGWASGLASEIDPDGPHVESVRLMADWYAKAQAPDGSWGPSTFLSPQPSLGEVMQKTAEHTLWVSFMISSLGGWLARHDR